MILDACVLLALMDPQDRLHAAARELVKEGPHSIHMVNMAEVVSVAHRASPAHARADLDILYRSPDLVISQAPVERLAGELHARRPSSKVSLADCIGVALALTTGQPFVTADRDVGPYVASDGLQLRNLGS